MPARRRSRCSVASGPRCGPARSRCVRGRAPHRGGAAPRRRLLRRHARTGRRGSGAWRAAVKRSCRARTHDVVADVLPDDVRLVDVGEHEMRGCGATRTSFSLEAPGLEPGEHAADRRAAHRCAGRLRRSRRRPRACRRCAGHARHRHDHGPGGIGKTRLLREVRAAARRGEHTRALLQRGARRSSRPGRGRGRAHAALVPDDAATTAMPTDPVRRRRGRRTGRGHRYETIAARGRQLRACHRRRRGTRRRHPRTVSEPVGARDQPGTARAPPRACVRARTTRGPSASNFVESAGRGRAIRLLLRRARDAAATSA